MVLVHSIVTLGCFSNCVNGLGSFISVALGDNLEMLLVQDFGILLQVSCVSLQSDLDVRDLWGVIVPHVCVVVVLVELWFSVRSIDSVSVSSLMPSCN